MNVYTQLFISGLFTLKGSETMLCFYGMNYLPLLLVVTSVVTFVVTYIWAIVNKDVSAYFPYIRYVKSV